MLDEMQEEEENKCKEKRWTKKRMLDEMQEEEEDKCSLRKKGEEEKYDKTKLSKLGRLIFELIIREMTKSQRENIQNHEKC